MISYDETKRERNIAKHGIDLAAIKDFFDGGLLTREDTRGAYGELRFQSVGWFDADMLFVVWTRARTTGRMSFRPERQKNMNAKPGLDSLDDDAPATSPDDWSDGFVTRSSEELRQAVAARRTRGPNRRPTKEQVAVRYSPEVLAYFRSTGPGWQTRMDEALREYVSKQQAA